MSKIILDLAVTLDGFIEGPNGEIDWLMGDGTVDFADILNDILVGIDAIFYGRVSYELWGNYIPEGDEDSRLTKAYDLLHSKQKYVFSETQKEDGSNAIFINSNIAEQVEEIRKKHKGNIWLYGGGKLTTTFINLGLVDVFRLAVHPVILGSGKPLFKDLKNRTDLKLVSTKIGDLGVLLLNYEKTS
jgi:dihydrofolate reductase